MTSNVGNPSLYEAKDQVTRPDSEIKKEQQEARFDEGKSNSHQANDPKDERSIANRLEKATSNDDDSGSGKKKTEEQKLGELDPTLPAKLHGNNPSKGAQIDAEILAEEQAELERKGRA